MGMITNNTTNMVVHVQRWIQHPNWTSLVSWMCRPVPSSQRCQAAASLQLNDAGLKFLESQRRWDLQLRSQRLTPGWLHHATATAWVMMVRGAMVDGTMLRSMSFCYRGRISHGNPRASPGAFVWAHCRHWICTTQVAVSQLVSQYSQLLKMQLAGCLVACLLMHMACWWSGG